MLKIFLKKTYAIKTYLNNQYVKLLMLKLGNGLYKLQIYLSFHYLFQFLESTLYTLRHLFITCFPCFNFVHFNFRHRVLTSGFILNEKS